jgi:hypothetical protein
VAQGIGSEFKPQDHKKKKKKNQRERESTFPKVKNRNEMNI